MNATLTATIMPAWRVRYAPSRNSFNAYVVELVHQGGVVTKTLRYATRPQADARCAELNAVTAPISFPTPVTHRECDCGACIAVDAVVCEECGQVFRRPRWHSMEAAMNATRDAYEARRTAAAENEPPF